MDIVPIVFNIKPYHTDSVTRPNVKHRISSTTGSYVPSGSETPTVYVESAHVSAMTGLRADVSGRLPIPRTLDEQADSAARKCLMHFGPGNNPRLSIGARNQVTVDAGGKIHLIDDLDEFKNTVGQRCVFLNVFILPYTEIGSGHGVLSPSWPMSFARKRLKLVSSLPPPKEEESLWLVPPTSVSHRSYRSHIQIDATRTHPFLLCLGRGRCLVSLTLIFSSF
jgi:hypothetical protein